MSEKKKDSPRILISPLNWGLGHASRLVPLIRHYRLKEFTILLGGNGFSLEVLRKEFPDLESVAIPFTEIRYSRSENQGFYFIIGLFRFCFALMKEHRVLNSIIKNRKIDVVISDNRLGLFSKEAKCIILTHQLWLSMPRGWKAVKYFANIFNHYLIRKFDECWVVDSDRTPNLAGDLSHPPLTGLPVRYIGPISRFADSQPVSGEKIELLVILGGPEPQRTILEDILIKQISATNIHTVIAGGTSESNQAGIKSTITYIPFAHGNYLAELIQHAEIIICRSGYSSIMDMIALQHSAILIPTPGQPEQEYLGTIHSEKGYFLKLDQAEFDLEKALEAWKKFKAQIPAIKFNLFPNEASFL